MKIQWIEFQNLDTGLKIERINFNRDVTLLVGLSGAGKTQILNAVEYSLRLAVDKEIELKPYKVGIGFQIQKETYEWFYEINQASEDGILEEEPSYEFIEEKLIKNGITVFCREGATVEIRGYAKVPYPKKKESLILQYSDDEKFASLAAEMRKMYSVETDLAVRGAIRSESFSKLKNRVEETWKREKQPDFKTFSHLPVAMKIYIAKKYYYEKMYVPIFEAVKELFIEIEDIDVVEDRTREAYLVSIQVYGKKILQYDISNGMLKTIYYIVELYTMSENSMVLIDEFENGLGVNCIDVLAELMLSNRSDLQYIITSHHPKIIGAIDENKWKIIDRDIDVIKNIDGDKYGIGNSQHDAYFNLINRWEFEGKI